jgi:hypothetical protein
MPAQSEQGSAIEPWEDFASAHPRWSDYLVKRCVQELERPVDVPDSVATHLLVNSPFAPLIADTLPGCGPQALKTLATGESYERRRAYEVAEVAYMLVVQTISGRWPQGALSRRGALLFGCKERIEQFEQRSSKVCGGVLVLSFFVEEAVPAVEYGLDVRLVVTCLPNMWRKTGASFPLPMLMHDLLLDATDRKVIRVLQEQLGQSGRQT